MMKRSHSQAMPNIDDIAVSWEDIDNEVLAVLSRTALSANRRAKIRDLLQTVDTARVRAFLKFVNGQIDYQQSLIDWQMGAVSKESIAGAVFMKQATDWAPNGMDGHRTTWQTDGVDDPPRRWLSLPDREVLGEGGFSTVSLINDTETDRAEAVKVISKDRLLRVKIRHGTRQSIYDEIVILAKVCHPHINQLLDWFETSKCVCIVLQRIRGQLLVDIAKSEPLSEKRAKNIARQCCHALAFVHSKEIAHRDVKPDNFMVSGLPKQDVEYVRLIDFGLSRVSQDNTGCLTKIGTPQYMAPEIRALSFVHERRFEKSYGYLADVWSLGLCFFAILTSRLPAYSCTYDNIPIDLTKELADCDITVSETAASFMSGFLQEQPSARLQLASVDEHEWLVPDM